jgi:polyphosphate kinase
VESYGSFSDKACNGIATQAIAWQGAACARSLAPNHVRHNPVAGRAAMRLVELGDTTRSPAARCEIAVAFSHELDTVFTNALRPPRSRLHHLVARYDRVLHSDLVPRLAAAGVTFPRWDELSSLDRAQMQRRFRERTFPLFTPMAVDSTHPLPQLASLELNIGLQVDGRLVLVAMSPHVPRLLAVRRGRYLTVESFVGALLPELLVGRRVAECTTFRITRSSHSGQPVRLEVERAASVGLVDTLARRFGVADADVYRLHSSLSMGDALAIEARRGEPRGASERSVVRRGRSSPAGEVAAGAAAGISAGS